MLFYINQTKTYFLKENKLMKNQYRVPTQNIASLEESIAHLNRRAKRLGTPAITLEKLELERVVTTDDFGVETVTFLQIVCVSGEAPKVNGWTFIATLEH